MKNLLLLALLAGSAHAATTYQPMPIPAGRVCMVELESGIHVNVNMIISVHVSNQYMVYEHKNGTITTNIEDQRPTLGGGNYVFKTSAVVKVAPRSEYGWPGSEEQRKKKYSEVMERIAACR